VGKCVKDVKFALPTPRKFSVVKLHPRPHERKITLFTVTKRVSIGPSTIIDPPCSGIP